MKTVTSSYPSCGLEFEECQRCDDYCAKKDGKTSRDDYKHESNNKDHSNTKNNVKASSSDDCNYDCTDWPYKSCKVHQINYNEHHLILSSTSRLNTMKASTLDISPALLPTLPRKENMSSPTIHSVLVDMRSVKGVMRCVPREMVRRVKIVTNQLDNRSL